MQALLNVCLKFSPKNAHLTERIFGRERQPPSSGIQDNRTFEKLSKQEKLEAALRLQEEIDKVLVAYREQRITIEEAVTFLQDPQRLRGTGNEQLLNIHKRTTPITKWVTLENIEKYA